MNDINDMGYQGEEIKLGGKIRHLKYSIPGLKIIAAKYGSVAEGFDKLKTMNPNFDVETLDSIALLTYAGLVHEDEKITERAIANMLDINNMGELTHKIIAAFNGSTPQDSEGGEGADPT